MSQEGASSESDESPGSKPERLVDLLRRAVPSFMPFGRMFRRPAGAARRAFPDRASPQSHQLQSSVQSQGSSLEDGSTSSCSLDDLAAWPHATAAPACAATSDASEDSLATTAAPPMSASLSMSSTARSVSAPELLPAPPAAGGGGGGAEDGPGGEASAQLSEADADAGVGDCTSAVDGNDVRHRTEGSSGSGSLPVHQMQRKMSEVLGEDLLFCAAETADKVEAISHEPRKQARRGGCLSEDCILEEATPPLSGRSPQAAATPCDEEGSTYANGNDEAEAETTDVAAGDVSERVGCASCASCASFLPSQLADSAEPSEQVESDLEEPEPESSADPDPDPTEDEGKSMYRVESDLFATAIEKVVPPQLSKQPGRAAGGMVLLHHARGGLRNRLGDDHDDGAATVLKLFYDSMPEQCIQIGSIQQVVQVKLLKRFLGKVAEARASIEATFHGTKKNCVENIMQHGLEPSLCQTGAYGRGAYVGTHAGVAHQYADPDAQGWRHMFVFLVVVGDKVMKGREGEQAVVTAMDRLLNPTQYCFVDASRLYVSHLIRYRVTEGVGGRVGGGWDDPFLRQLNLAVFRASQLEQRTGVR